MDKKILEIKDLIKIQDGVLPIEIIANLIKILSKKESYFHEANIFLGKKDLKDKTIRNTLVYNLGNYLENDLCGIHWYNLIGSIFWKNIRNYIQSNKIRLINNLDILEMQILKYQEGGFFKPHCDFHIKTPRTLSLVLFLNNDYEGGDLKFFDVNLNEIMTVEKFPGRLVIFPSNFMYPHVVEPVKKGTRYSIVSWAS